MADQDQLGDWLETQRDAGGRWQLDCGKPLPMADPTDVPWCVKHGLLDWRPFGYRLVLPDGRDVTGSGPPFQHFPKRKESA